MQKLGPICKELGPGYPMPTPTPRTYAYREEKADTSVKGVTKGFK